MIRPLVFSGFPLGLGFSLSPRLCIKIVAGIGELLDMMFFYVTPSTISMIYYITQYLYSSISTKWHRATLRASFRFTTHQFDFSAHPDGLVHSALPNISTS